MKTIMSARLRISIPECIVTELEELLETQSIDSLKKLSDRIDSTMFLSNAQRGKTMATQRTITLMRCLYPLSIHGPQPSGRFYYNT
jgi:rRNA-processing protein FCF1